MSDCYAPGAKGRNGSFDLAVVGAARPDFSAAITAADQGAQVALIGHGTIGGTCVNIGCVPSKTLIRAAETLHQTRARRRASPASAPRRRTTTGGRPSARRTTLVAELRQSKYADLLPAYNDIAYLEGPARLVEGGVGVNGERVTADKIIIATGARPACPAIRGHRGRSPI